MSLVWPINCSIDRQLMSSDTERRDVAREGCKQLEKFKIES